MSQKLSQNPNLPQNEKTGAKVEKLSQKQEFDADSAPTKSTRKVSVKTRCGQAKNLIKPMENQLFYKTRNPSQGTNEYTQPMISRKL